MKSNAKVPSEPHYCPKCKALRLIGKPCPNCFHPLEGEALAEYIKSVTSPFCKQVNVEIKDKGVYEHIKAQGHMGNYLTRLVEQDMGLQQSIAQRLASLEERINYLEGR